MGSSGVTKEQLDFIPIIYDTMVNPENWVNVLDQLAYHCGSAGSSLMFGDNVYPEISDRIVSTELGITYFETNLEDYNTKFGKDEADALEVVSQYPVQTWVSDETAFKKPADEIPCTLFGREMFGLDRRMAVRLNDTPIWFDGISLNYKLGRANMSDEENRVSQLFLPHLAKALEINRPFSLLHKRFQSILSVLDYMKVGVVIMTSTGEVLILNKEADNVFSANNGIALSSNKKIILRSQEHLGMLSSRVLAASNPDNPTDYEGTIVVPKRGGGLSWLMDVLPLSNLQGDIDGKFKGAALFITDPDREDVISTKGMDALFKLTSAESEVCALLTQGLKINEVADARNVSQGTVRTQVKSLFAKTNSNSQVDLVRLALKVNLPVEESS